MTIPESPLAAAQQLDLLTIFGDLTEEIAGFGIEDGGAHRHFDGAILAIAAVAPVGAAALAVGGEDMSLITKR